MQLKTHMYTEKLTNWLFGALCRTKPLDSDSRGRRLGWIFKLSRTGSKRPANLLQVALRKQPLSAQVRTSAEVCHCFRALFQRTSACLTCWHSVNFMFWTKTCQLVLVSSPLVYSNEASVFNTCIKCIANTTAHNIHILPRLLLYHFQLEITQCSVKIVSAGTEKHMWCESICGLTTCELLDKESASILSPSCSCQPSARPNLFCSSFLVFLRQQKK